MVHVIQKKKVISMDKIEKKFRKLGVENAPGQKKHQDHVHSLMRGEKYPGSTVDFSHGDVDAFPPIPNALDLFIKGVNEGGAQAYTPYKGSESIVAETAIKLSKLTGSIIDPNKNLLITPGTQTQGALFLAMGSTMVKGDKVAIVEPDYFANRKLVEFFEGEIVPIQLDYLNKDHGAGIDLNQLEKAFKAGVTLFLFSNPNNPTGAMYSVDEVYEIGKLAQQYGVKIISDELYSRQTFDGRKHAYLSSQKCIDPEHHISIIGPSKTESLSGYRLGVAFGSSYIMERMEKLQAVVSLRAAGYNQAVLRSWLAEPKGWLNERILLHQQIRDDLLKKLRTIEGLKVRPTEAGSYLFPSLPELNTGIEDFVHILRIQANVIVTPGTEFGSLCTNSFRINFSQNHKNAVDAMGRLIHVMEHYRK